MKHKQNGLDSAATDDQALNPQTERSVKESANIMTPILPTGAAIQLQLVSSSVFAEWQSSGSRTGRELRRWIKRKQARAAK